MPVKYEVAIVGSFLIVAAAYASPPVPYTTPSTGAVEVTPQMMDKLEKVNTTIDNKKSNVAQKYDAKTQQMIETANAHGYTVDVVSSRGGDVRSNPDYYVVGPDGGVVDVSTAQLGNGDVQKTIAYVPAGSNVAEQVAVNISHADAKAAKIAENGNIENESKSETAIKAAAAVDVAVKRGNVQLEADTLEPTTTP